MSRQDLPEEHEISQKIDWSEILHQNFLRTVLLLEEQLRIDQVIIIMLMVAIREYLWEHLLQRLEKLWVIDLSQYALMVYAMVKTERMEEMELMVNL